MKGAVKTNIPPPTGHWDKTSLPWQPAPPPSRRFVVPGSVNISSFVTASMVLRN